MCFDIEFLLKSSNKDFVDHFILLYISIDYVIMRHMIFNVSDLKVAHGALIIVIVRDLLQIISFEVP